MVAHHIARWLRDEEAACLPWPFHRHCCQSCCQAAGRHLSRVDSCGMSTPAHVQQWTILNDAPIPTDLCSYASCVLVER